MFQIKVGDKSHSGLECEKAAIKLICLDNNYIPITRNGITLKFITKYTKRKIIKTNISLGKLQSFDEILLVGSGKGVVALNNIPQIKWINKTQIIYKELQELYKSYIER